MKRPVLPLYAAALLWIAFAATPGQAHAQTQPQASPSGQTSPGALSWDQVKARFEAANPALKADALGVDEMKAAEITAYLRPNPQFTFATDGTQR